MSTDLKASSELYKQVHEFDSATLKTGNEDGSSLCRQNTYVSIVVFYQPSVHTAPAAHVLAHNVRTQAPRTATRILLFVTQYSLPITVSSARQHLSKIFPAVRATSLLRNRISTRYAFGPKANAKGKDGTTYQLTATRGAVFLMPTILALPMPHI